MAGALFAGEPVLTDAKGRQMIFDTTAKLQKEWNAYVKAHGINRNGYILYTPYSSKFRPRWNSLSMTRALTIFCRLCDVEDTTVYGGS